eukprot:6207850-Pleurochrysis_carterae.AAC.2
MAINIFNLNSAARKGDMEALRRQIPVRAHVTPFRTPFASRQLNCLLDVSLAHAFSFPLLDFRSLASITAPNPSTSSDDALPGFVSYMNTSSSTTCDHTSAKSDLLRQAGHVV